MTDLHSDPIAALASISPDDYDLFLSDFTWLASAAATEPNRPPLSVIAIATVEGQLAAFASDGYRLHILWNPGALLLRQALRVGNADYAFIPLPQTVSWGDTKPVLLNDVLNDMRAAAPFTVDVRPLEEVAQRLCADWGDFHDDEPLPPLLVEYRAGKLHFRMKGSADYSGILRAKGGVESTDTLGVDPHYLRDALSLFADTTVRINSGRNMIGFGEVGQRMAVIMGVRPDSLALARPSAGAAEAAEPVEEGQSTS